MLKNEVNNKFSTISKILFYSALFILSFIFFNILISTIFFIFKISISKYFLFCSGILSILLNLYLIKKNEDTKKIISLVSIILPIILIFSSIILCGKVYDYTWDGNSYHKSTIGEMMDGWNPLYEKMEEFDQNNPNSINVGANSYIWGNHYAKASHIFAANVGVVTNNIESGKCINVLSILMLFMFLMSFLLYEKKKVFFSLLFSICIITCTTISSQFLTNYVDLLVYIYFFMTILSFFLFEKSTLFKSKNNYLIMYFMVLVIGTNIKFSLFAYAGLFCLGYFIWYIIRFIKKDIDKEFFIKFIITSALAVIVAVFVVGLSVYPKNFIEKGNPFYPLMGENKIDIMTQNQPDYFKNKSALEKFTIATFSRAGNISEASGLEATYKIPFSIYPEEIAVLSSCDLRISGNGIFYSGILLISCIILCIYMFKIYKKDKTIFYLMIIPTCITILMIFFLSESWWARYFPQLHLIVFFALLSLEMADREFANYLLYMIIAVLLVNNYLVFENSIGFSLNYTRESNKEYYIFENSYDNNKCKLKLYTDSFHGALYNVLEKEKDYSITFINENIYQENKDEYNEFMNGYIFWRCD